MGVLPKQDIQFTLGSLEQRKGEKHIYPGKLTVAENCYQSKEKVYRKRNGFTAWNTTTDSGSIGSVRSLDNLGGVDLALQGSSTLFIRDNPNNRWKNVGTYRPTMSTYEIAEPALAPTSTLAPAALEVVDLQSRRWVFLRSGGSLRYKVTDSAGNELVSSRTFATTTSGFFKPVLDTAGTVWCLHIATNVDIYKFNSVTPSTAPTTTTVNVGFTPVGIDAIATSNDPLVYAPEGGATGRVALFYLNPATGIAKVAPGVVTTASASTASPPATAASVPGGLVELNQSGSSLYYFTALTSTGGAGAAWQRLAMWSVNATTLVATENLFSAAIPANHTSLLTAASATGFVDAAGTMVILLTWLPQIGTYPGAIAAPLATDSAEYTVTRWQRTSGGAVTSALLGNHMRPASKVVAFDGSPHFVAEFLDFNGSQFCYHLVNANTGELVCRALYEEIGGGLTGSLRAVLGVPSVSGTTLRFLGTTGVDKDVSAARMSFDVSPSGLSAPASNGVDLVYPGALPVRLTSIGAGATALTSEAPLIFPTTVKVMTSAGAAVGIAMCFVIRLPDGRLKRSAFSPTQSVAAGTSFSVAIASDKWTRIAGTTEAIEVYSGTPASPTSLFLQATVPVDKSSTWTTATVSAVAGTGPLAYTTGGIVDNEPLPPFRRAAHWNSRTFVYGTPVRGQVSYTDAPEEGTVASGAVPYSFNVGGGAEIYAAAGIGEVAMVFFTEAGIYAIQGKGADAVGNNNYEAVRVSEGATCRNIASVVSTPVGVIFQGLDGKIWLFDRSSQLIHVGRGVEDVTDTITAAVHVPAMQQVRLSSMLRTIVLDYGRISQEPATQADQLCQWYVWPTVAAGVSAAILADVQYHALAPGQVYREVAGQSYDQSSAGTQTFIGQKYEMPVTFAGVAGFASWRRGFLVGTTKGNHRLSVTLESDGAPQPFATKDVTGTFGFDFKANLPKAGTHKLRIEELQYLSTLNAGFELEGLGCQVQVEPGGRRFPTANRL